MFIPYTTVKKESTDYGISLPGGNYIIEVKFEYKNSVNPSLVMT